MTLATPASAERPKKYTVKLGGEVIGKAELRMVPIGAVKIDSAYQRGVSTDWVNKHLPFNGQQAGAIVLSGRAGGPYCIDGGHRLALARESGVPSIAAFVIEGLAQRDEAGLFTRYQRERRNLVSFDLFRADKISGDPDTLAMERVVANSGFHIGKSKANDNTITAIDALRYVQRLGGDDLLSLTLRTVRGFWLGEEKALSGQVIKGVAMFIASAAEQPNFNQATLDKYLTATAPVKLLRASQAVSVKRSGAPAVTAANVAEAIHEGYNKLVRDESSKLTPLTIGKRARPVRPWSRT